MTTLKALNNTTRKYYKYQTQSWSQPTLTDDGGVVDNFSALNYYHAFLPNTTYATFYRNENRGWLEVYMHSPTGIIPKSFSFYVQNRTDASSGAYNIAFYGTNEDWVMHTPIPSGCNNSTRNGINTGAWASAWTIIGTSGNVGDGKSGTVDMSSNTQHYKWLRFECSTYGTANNDRLTIKNFNLTADQRVIVSGTSSNYDFYQDIPYKKSIMEDYGTKPSSNYKIIDTLRPGVVKDTGTDKETSSTATVSLSSIGTICSWNNDSVASPRTISATTAYNPTNGSKRVRPISATFTSTTVSSQYGSVHIQGFHGDTVGSTWSWSWDASAGYKSTTFIGTTKGTYNVTWSNTPFHYWWALAPVATGWQSGTQTITGTLSNVVWEVENTGTTVPNIKCYMFT